MRKKILILFVLLLLTGCTVNYSYNFDDNTEVIELLNNNDTYGTNLERSLQDIIDINRDETSFTGYYQFDKIIGDINSGISLDYSYPNVSEYQEYSQFLRCYNNPQIEVTEKIINVNITSRIDCSENFDSASITLSAIGSLVETNADKIDKNNYTWNIKDKSDKDIILVVDRTKEKSDNFKLTDLIIIFGSIFAILIIAVIILVRKKNDNNKI